MWKNVTTLFLVVIFMALDIQAYKIADVQPLIDAAGSSSVSMGFDTEQDPIPQHFEVWQNYPNPFNATTIIEYDLPDEARVNVVVYNIFLQRIKTLTNRLQLAGKYKLEWDGTTYEGNKAASGIYIFVLLAGNNYFIGKMILLK